MTKEEVRTRDVSAANDVVLSVNIDDETLPWSPLNELPGFERDEEYPGTVARFLGGSENGPWSYLFRNSPGVVIERHEHDCVVIHYIVRGGWEVEGEIERAGLLHIEGPGVAYGPMEVLPEGADVLIVYERYPGNVGLQLSS